MKAGRTREFGIRRLISCLCILIGTAGAAFAEEWSFHYGPDRGEHPTESYTYVSAGENYFVTRSVGDQGVSLMAVVGLGTFDNGGKVQRNLEDGRPLILDILRESDRYERSVEPDDFIWKPGPGDQMVTLYILLQKDDVLAMVNGRALFVQSDTLQFRFGLVNADEAIYELVDVLEQTNK